MDGSDQRMELAALLLLPTSWVLVYLNVRKRWSLISYRSIP